jgi:threonine aldolase
LLHACLHGFHAQAGTFFPLGTNGNGTCLEAFTLLHRSFLIMPLAQIELEELNALRELEKAVRACGLPTIMVSGQAQLESLAKALKAIEDARASAAGTTPRRRP